MLTLVKNRFARTKNRRQSVRLNLEPLEERWCPASVDLLWSPQGGSTLASLGSNWYCRETGTWGTSPLNAPGANVYLGDQSTAPITWDTGSGSSAVYDTNIFNVASNYSAVQEIKKSVTITTSSVNCPGLLNLTFDGPTNDQTYGSYFYLGTGANTINNMALDASILLPRSGNFIISSGANLILAEGSVLPDQTISNTSFDVYGSLTINNGQSPLLMQDSSWLRIFTGAHLTMDDRNSSMKFIDSDNSSNMLFIYPQGDVQIDCTGNGAPDVVKVGILDMGIMDVQGDGTGTTLSLAGSVDPNYAPGGYAIDVIPLPGGSQPATGNSSPSPLTSTGTNATLTLLDKVVLYCPYGYYQAGVSSNLTATLATDEKGNTVQTDSAHRIVINTYSFVQFFDDPGTWGQLSFLSSGVDFNGTLIANVDRASSNCDAINVKTGNIVFGATASILPQLQGSGTQTSWQVFQDQADSWFNWNSVSVPSGWTLGNPGIIND